jgi:hypothetical protein
MDPAGVDQGPDERPRDIGQMLCHDDVGALSGLLR